MGEPLSVDRLALEARELATDAEGVFARRAREDLQSARELLERVRRSFEAAGGDLEEFDAAVLGAFAVEARPIPAVCRSGGGAWKAWRRLERLVDGRVGGGASLGLRLALSELGAEERRAEGLLEQLGQAVADAVGRYEHRLRERAGESLPAALADLEGTRAACQAWGEALRVLTKHLGAEGG